MGNYSGNTFDALKHYVGVRLQQGVPIVDADWNELEDIRRYELESFLRWFVGDGIPKGSDGFRITALAAQPQNDFAIAAGWCLVNGWQVENQAAQMTYRSQLSSAPEPPQTQGPGAVRTTRSNRRSQSTAASMGSLPGTLPALPGGPQHPGISPSLPGALPNIPGVPQPLTTPTQDRTDLVYLDVWEREVDSSEDPDLINEKIGIETCRRMKREWTVWVVEGMSNPEDLTPAGGHACYPLALLHRRAGVAEIPSADIEDLRRTGVASISAPLTIKDNKVGIGTSDPGAGLEISKGSTNDLALLLSSSGPGWGSGLQFKNNGQGGKTYGIYSGWGSLHFADIEEEYDRLIIDSDGNIGMGTADPTCSLHIERYLNSEVHLLVKNTVGSGTRTYVTAAPGISKIQTDRDFAISTSINGSWSDKLTVLNNGNVGIGKTEPETKLHISGSDHVKISIDSPANKEAGIILQADGENLWEFYRDETGDLRIWESGIADRVTVKPGGNVGIGTTDPGEFKLCVSGDTKIEGDLTFGGDIITCIGGEITQPDASTHVETVWFQYRGKKVLGIRYTDFGGVKSWDVVIPAHVNFVQEK